MAEDLPRKLLSGTDARSQELRSNLSKWKVHYDCAVLWDLNRTNGRKDTFIGIIDMQSWMIYLAPCFGVEPHEALAKLATDDQLGQAHAKFQASGPGTKSVQNPATKKMETKNLSFHDSLLSYAGAEAIRKRLVSLDVPGDLALVAGSTSKEADASRRETWDDVKNVYKAKGACLVLFQERGKGFDGYSHQALSKWAVAHLDDPKPRSNFFMEALGFAIQRDSLGYYVRFASMLNKGPGQNVSATGRTLFVKRKPQDFVGDESSTEAKDLRDLPKEWAIALVSVLARDLKMGCFSDEVRDTRDPSDRTQAGKLFGRLISRGTPETTKYKRVYDLTDTNFQNDVSRRRLT